MSKTKKIKTKIFKVRIEPERGRPFNLYVQAKKRR